MSRRRDSPGLHDDLRGLEGRRSHDRSDLPVRRERFSPVRDALRSQGDYPRARLERFSPVRDSLRSQGKPAGARGIYEDEVLTGSQATHHIVRLSDLKVPLRDLPTIAMPLWNGFYRQNFGGQRPQEEIQVAGCIRTIGT